MEFNLSKSTVEVYKLRGKHGYWADITIDAQEQSGRIQIASDFGSWQHYWGACGEGFKEFLCGLEIYYAAGKFGEGRWFNADATIAQIKKDIEESDCDDNEKEEMLEDLSTFEDCDDQALFVHQCWECDKLRKIWGDGPNIITDISPAFRKFWDNAWPVLIAEFKEEARLAAHGLISLHHI